jgi:hypothetical protein
MPRVKDLGSLEGVDCVTSRVGSLEAYYRN